MKVTHKIIVILVLVLLMSFVFMYFIRIGNDEIGLKMVKQWCNERGESSTTEVSCLNMINSLHEIIKQTIALAFFFFVIALTIIRMEWRTSAAILALIPLLVTGVAPPQYLINAVAWDLIVFLIGSMTLAGILRELGVFRYLALRVLEISKGNAIILILLISLMAFFLSAALGEVTSIIYVTMLVFEISRIVHVDAVPLIILSVLATNTGSTALPIGNPIGVYILFETNMSVTQFIKNAFPLALIDLIVLVLVLLFIERSTMKELIEKIMRSKHRIEAYISSQRIEFGSNNKAYSRLKRIYIGLVILILFILTVALNDVITQGLSNVLKIFVDPHASLSFIPYVFIAITLILAIPMEEISRFIERSVEWSSLLFFIFLFMFGYTLTYTGVMTKLAYAFSHIGLAPLTLLALMLFSSALLSSVLDNLSVIVAFTPIAMTFNGIGLIGNQIYFALLFGGVFGGNYTPVGSTANIIAVSLAEKRRIRITWGRWLRIALATTTLQIIVALSWLYIASYVLHL